MINVGDSNISVYIGDTELTVYAGDVQIYPMNLGTLTGITLDNLTWATDVSFEGGTASSANCTFSVTAHYDSGKTRRITNQATITSTSIEVPSTMIESREYVGTITVTATYSGFTDSDTVNAYQEAYSPCSPVTINNLIPNTNNQGLRKSGFYIFDSGITEITDCDYDFTGIKCICARADGFYGTPNACLGYANTYATNDNGCLSTLEYVNISIPTVQYLRYPFGCDESARTSQTLTSVTFTNTNSLTQVRQTFNFCKHLVTANLGDWSKVNTAQDGQFRQCVSLQNVTVTALPKMSMTNWYWSDCTALTETSVINILNALPTYSGTITLGSTNINKLTSVEGQTALTNARNRGWTVN